MKSFWFKRQSLKDLSQYPISKDWDLCPLVTLWPRDVGTQGEEEEVWGYRAHAEHNERDLPMQRGNDHEVVRDGEKKGKGKRKIFCGKFYHYASIPR